MSRRRLACRSWSPCLAFTLALALAPSAGAAGPVQLRAAADHQLLLRPDGAVLQWGVTDYGRMKDYYGNCNLTFQRTAAPVAVAGLPPAAAVVPGLRVNHALTRGGDVYAWGLDPAMGLPGNCSAVTPTHQVWRVQDPSDPSGFLTGVVALWGSSDSFFAARRDGSVVAWGANGVNKLGVQVAAQSTSTQNPPASVNVVAAPLPVKRLAEGPYSAAAPGWPVAVVAGGSHALALMPDGAVRAWGGDAYGERGDGSYNHPGFPYWNGRAWYDLATGATVGGFTSLVAGPYKSLGLKDGAAWAWGWNRAGELGTGIPMEPDPSARGVNVPTALPTPAGRPGPVALAGGTQHTVLLLGDGTVWALGWNGQGQLGSNPFTTAQHTFQAAVQVAGLAGITLVEAAGDCSVALQSDGRVWEWGYCDGTIQWAPFVVGGGPLLTGPACGGADGQPLAAAPTTGLCAVGTASAVAGAGPWTWTCAQGGSTAACTAGRWPLILAQPRSVRVLKGRPATFTVVARGPAALAYQWYREAPGGDVPLRDHPGLPPSFHATSYGGTATAQLKLGNVQPSAAGRYYVVVTDAAGSTRSDSAALDVLEFVKPRPKPFPAPGM